MKIQCSCGAKYVFEVAPEMLEKPVRFVCTSCGLDASEYVNSLVRQELGADSESESQRLGARPSPGIVTPDYFTAPVFSAPLEHPTVAAPGDLPVGHQRTPGHS